MSADAELARYARLYLKDERKYNQNLSLLAREYAAPVRKYVDGRSKEEELILNIENLPEKIFPGVDVLFDYSHLLLSALERLCFSQHIPKDTADIVEWKCDDIEEFCRDLIEAILTISPSTKLYSHYVENYLNATFEIKKAMGNSKEFSSIIQTANADAGVPLPQLLAAPIQQAPRYNKLVAGVIKSIEDADADKTFDLETELEDLRELGRRYGELVALCLRKKEESGHMKKLKALQEKIIGGDIGHSLVEINREFLGKKEVYEIHTESGEGKEEVVKDRVAFLLSDMLILTRASRKKKWKGKFELRAKIPLLTVKVSKVEGNDRDIIIRARTAEFRIRALSAEDHKWWMETLTEVVEKLQGTMYEDQTTKQKMATLTADKAKALIEQMYRKVDDEKPKEGMRRSFSRRSKDFASLSKQSPEPDGFTSLLEEAKMMYKDKSRQFFGTLSARDDPGGNVEAGKGESEKFPQKEEAGASIEEKATTLEEVKEKEKEGEEKVREKVKEAEGEGLSEEEPKKEESPLEDSKEPFSEAIEKVPEESPREEKVDAETENKPETPPTPFEEVEDEAERSSSNQKTEDVDTEQGATEDTSEDAQEPPSIPDRPEKSMDSSVDLFSMLREDPTSMKEAAEKENEKSRRKSAAEAAEEFKQQTARYYDSLRLSGRYSESELDEELETMPDSGHGEDGGNREVKSERGSLDVKDQRRAFFKSIRKKKSELPSGGRAGLEDLFKVGDKTKFEVEKELAGYCRVRVDNKGGLEVGNIFRFSVIVDDKIFELSNREPEDFNWEKDITFYITPQSKKIRNQIVEVELPTAENDVEEVKMNCSFRSYVSGNLYVSVFAYGEKIHGTPFFVTFLPETFVPRPSYGPEYEAATIKLQSWLRGQQARKELQKTSKASSYRQKIANELYESEKLYVANLRFMVEQYVKPLEKMMEEGNDILDPSKIKRMFFGVVPICEVHEVLLQSLEERISPENWFVTQKVGEVFIKHKDLFQIYVPYIQNFDEVQATANIALKESEEFEKFVRERREMKESNRLDLQSFLILPIQRVPRYELLLQDLLKRTWEEHPDSEDLHAAVKAIHEIGEFINEQKRETDNFKKIEAISRRLLITESTVDIEVADTGKRSQQGFQLVKETRKYVMESKIDLYWNGMVSEMFCYVFNDIVIFVDGDAESEIVIQMEDEPEVELTLVISLLAIDRVSDGVAFTVVKRKKGDEETEEKVYIEESVSNPELALSIETDEMNRGGVVLAFSDVEEKDKWLAALEDLKSAVDTSNMTMDRFFELSRNKLAQQKAQEAKSIIEASYKGGVMTGGRALLLERKKQRMANAEGGRRVFEVKTYKELNVERLASEKERKEELLKSAATFQIEEEKRIEKEKELEQAPDSKLPAGLASESSLQLLSELQSFMIKPVPSAKRPPRKKVPHKEKPPRSQPHTHTEAERAPGRLPIELPMLPLKRETSVEDDESASSKKERKKEERGVRDKEKEHEREKKEKEKELEREARERERKEREREKELEREKKEKEKEVEKEKREQERKERERQKELERERKEKEKELEKERRKKEKELERREKEMREQEKKDKKERERLEKEKERESRKAAKAEEPNADFPEPVISNESAAPSLADFEIPVVALPDIFTKELKEFEMGMSKEAPEARTPPPAPPSLKFIPGAPKKKKTTTDRKQIYRKSMPAPGSRQYNQSLKDIQSMLRMEGLQSRGNKSQPEKSRPMKKQPAKEPPVSKKKVVKKVIKKKKIQPKRKVLPGPI